MGATVLAVWQGVATRCSIHLQYMLKVDSAAVWETGVVAWLLWQEKPPGAPPI